MDFSELRKKIYFSNDIKDLVVEIEKRRLNNDINTITHDYFFNHDHDMEDIFSSGPYAVLSRSVASPNKEQLLFVEYAKRNNLQPIIFEYDGKFVTKNKEKLFLCNIYTPLDNSIAYKLQKIVDTNFYQGKKMSDIKTYWGQGLEDFHRSIYSKYYSTSLPLRKDFTHWFDDTRGFGSSYYFFFLLIFIKDAILFENYLLEDSSEYEFTITKVLPSIEQVEDQTGLKPLIFPLLPFDTENNNIKWLSYDKKISDEIDFNLYNS